MKPGLSIIIIAANVESTIKDCLLSCQFADEIIIITNATDNTISIAKATIPTVQIYQGLSANKFNFAAARNLGLRYAKYPWILYVDDDERITPALREQITKSIRSPGLITNFDLPRANYYLGHRVKFGGSYPDYVKRLFHSNAIKGYTGKLHEQPIVTGPEQKLTAELIHLTHQTLRQMLEKSNTWTKLEAELLFNDNHPPVVWWRFFRMMLTKIWERLVVQNMWRDGIVGWISVIFEAFDTYMIYAQLYELQTKSA